jgi:hypothetical protein
MKPFMNHSSLKFFSSENNRLVTESAAFDNLIPKFQLVLPTSHPLNSSHYQITFLKFPFQ